jgi:SAM-dependent MidA family methyltransferase
MATLRDIVVDIIAAEGPISVERYMALCLGHPTLGYYMRQEPFGAGGDFTTAPEISQMFGELIGLWTAETWRLMGAHTPFTLIELGPGRGTLMADALRALRRAMPACFDAAEVALVETSPRLRAIQQERLTGAHPRLSWHAAVGATLTGPAILIGNEFLDALSVRQYVAGADGWRERVVALDQDGALRFGVSGAPIAGLPAPRHPPGTIIERPEAALSVVRTIASHLAAARGAALFIDYGAARTGTGDTLQAVRGHAFADPLAEPGLADLTTQVPFDQVADAARAAGALAHGPVTQADFLGALGIAARADALCRNATPEQVAAIHAALRRLTDTETPTAMGALFKALALSHPALGALPAFPPPA